MSLSLQLNGDLANRIEALVSGICWAEELGVRLEVWWWMFPKGIQCSFAACIDIRSVPSDVGIRDGHLLESTVIRSQTEFIEKGYPTVIQSKSRFYERDSKRWLHYLQMIQPSYQISSRIRITPFQSSVGIYIHSMNQPPLAKVLAEVWTKHRDKTHFLVSTDSEETKRFLDLMFRNRVSFTNPQIAPFSKQYYLDQTYDFFCFTRCELILDCTGAALPRVAAEKAEIPLVLL